jgi:hypothetical protein
MKVRDLNQAAVKFSTNGQAGSNNYKSGVLASSTWAQNTEAAAPTWQAGVTAPGAAARFSANVGKAGNAKWQQRASTTGQSRFSQAMSDPQTKQNWSTNFAPFAAVIAGITPQPKGVRGSPNNYNSVKTIGDALHAKKVGG